MQKSTRTNRTEDRRTSNKSGPKNKPKLRVRRRDADQESTGTVFLLPSERPAPAEPRRGGSVFINFDEQE